MRASSFLVAFLALCLSWAGGASLLLAQCELQKLTASDAAEGDGFGSSVGLNGIVMAVGTPGDDDAANGRLTESESSLREVG